MDRTPENYAYRCIPMTAANIMGWEILNPVNWEFRRNGLTPHTQVIVYREKELRFGHRSAQCDIPGPAKPAASNCFLQSHSWLFWRAADKKKPRYFRGFKARRIRHRSVGTACVVIRRARHSQLTIHMISIAG